MFAETGNVNDCFSFADQGKQTSVFHFPFAEDKRKFAVANKQKLPFSFSSVFPIYIENSSIYIDRYTVYTYRYKYNLYIYISIYLYPYFYIRSRFQIKAQVIFLNLFIVCSSCKRKFEVCHLSVCILTPNGIFPFANGLNGLNGQKGLYRLDRLAHLCL